MKAIIQDAYGSPDDVLELRDIDVPAIKDDEVLVEVHAAAVAGDDWHLDAGRAVRGSARHGAAQAEAPCAGPRRRRARARRSVRPSPRFRPGDEVFGWCDGAFAEHVAVPAEPARPTSRST